MRAVRIPVGLLILLLLMPMGSGCPAWAASDLDRFLQTIQERAVQEQHRNMERELTFRADLDGARRQIREMRQRLDAAQDQQERLLADFETNEQTLMALETTLRERQGDLGEMFGVVRQSAGDFFAQFLGPLAMADQPEALDFVHRLSNSRGLPDIEELERFWLLILEEMVAAVAPLLGLLGTVVGMINTFQSITLFGTGDPQLMAGGISQALVTTALGLTVAIPLLLLHSIAAAKSRGLVNIMEEQGAGLLAEHMQRQRAVGCHG